MDFMMSVLKNMDEFKMFKELLLFLQNNGNETYLNWEKTLDENQKQLVNKLFGTKRINISTENNNNIQIPRRIVSIKRNQNQDNNNQ